MAANTTSISNLNYQGHIKASGQIAILGNRSYDTANCKVYNCNVSRDNTSDTAPIIIKLNTTGYTPQNPKIFISSLHIANSLVAICHILFFFLRLYKAYLFPEI